MMKVYYAHSMGLYNTPQETRDVETLTKLGLEVVNPNNAEISESFKARQVETFHLPDGYLVAFEVFFELVRECEVFAFRALPDGRIPGGVAIELQKAQAAGKIIIELPCNTIARTMTGEQTREYLHDVGQR